MKMRFVHCAASYTACVRDSRSTRAPFTSAASHEGLDGLRRAPRPRKNVASGADAPRTAVRFDEETVEGPRLSAARRQLRSSSSSLGWEPSRCDQATPRGSARIWLTPPRSPAFLKQRRLWETMFFHR